MHYEPHFSSMSAMERAHFRKDVSLNYSQQTVDKVRKLWKNHAR